MATANVTDQIVAVVAPVVHLVSVAVVTNLPVMTMKAVVAAAEIS